MLWPGAPILGLLLALLAAGAAAAGPVLVSTRPPPAPVARTSAAPGAGDPVLASARPAPAQTRTPAPVAATQQPPTATRASARPPLAWEDGSAERRAWSEALRATIRPRLAAFDRARDMRHVCPAYRELTEAARIDVIATLIVAVAKFESGHNPDATVGDPPVLQGLFQLNTKGFSDCANGRPLTDPLVNIGCAVPAMATLTSGDGRLMGGGGVPAATGIARWWTVLRDGPKGTATRIRAMTRSLPACGG